MPRNSVGLILPEVPGAVAVFHRGAMLGRADPDRIVGQLAIDDRRIEIDRGVDHGLLAVKVLHLDQHGLDLLQGRLALQPFGAGRRIGRGFHVEHRRQGVALRRHVLLEPGHVLVPGPAPIDEMIGPVRQARRLGALPVLNEFRIDAVAALGRLDIGELDAAIVHGHPVDIALVFRHIHAVDGEIAGELRRLGFLVVAGTRADERFSGQNFRSRAAGRQREE